MYLRAHRGLDDLLIRGVGSAVADILAHRPGEHENILRDEPDAPPQTVLRQCAHILPVDKHRARRDIVKPRQELAERRLPSAGGTHDRQTLPRRDVQVYVLQHRHAVCVCEADVLYSISPHTSRSSFASGASFIAGSVRMTSRKREKPAVPCIYTSANCVSFFMGVTNVDT